ncbi:hypothetical protein BC834DRAFT_975473 [Gloeopeniophorella convolvens]|nr:hypothetical protein BC834DRAFT_975473 [Gloeopeniophorella convolvens]
MLKFTEEMDQPLPFLCHLSLRLHPSPHAAEGLVLSNGFLNGGAPRLRSISLDNVLPPSLARLLSSTQQLTSLSLQIPKIACIYPDELLAPLDNLPHLTYLSVKLTPMTLQSSGTGSIALGLASQNIVLLPRLEQFVFCGDSWYLEALLSGIDVSSVESLNIKLLFRLNFTIPHLSDLIASAPLLSHGSIARVDFTPSSGELHIYPRIEDAQAISAAGVHIVVPNKRFDWQTYSIAQLCHALGPGLSRVQSLFVGYHLKKLPLQWRREVPPSIWTMVLQAFWGVRTLWVSKALVSELLRALHPGDGGSVDDLPMPALDAIVAPSDEPYSRRVQSIVHEAFEPFCAARPNVQLTYVAA